MPSLRWAPHRAASYPCPKMPEEARRGLWTPLCARGLEVLLPPKSSRAPSFLLFLSAAARAAEVERQLKNKLAETGWARCADCGCSLRWYAPCRTHYYCLLRRITRGSRRQLGAQRSCAAAAKNQRARHPEVQLQGLLSITITVSLMPLTNCRLPTLIEAQTAGTTRRLRRARANDKHWTTRRLR